MVTGDLKNQIDRIWDAFWSGGISNPMEAIEQMTYLLFIKPWTSFKRSARRRRTASDGI